LRVAGTGKSVALAVVGQDTEAASSAESASFFIVYLLNLRSRWGPKPLPVVHASSSKALLSPIAFAMSRISTMLRRSVCKTR
jgi:hypothetical protein